MIYHIIEKNEYPRFAETNSHHPTSLDSEGFVHCTGNKADLLEVANKYFRNKEVLILEIDDGKVDALVKWEKAPGDRVERLFPHIYGELKLSWVAGLKVLTNDRDHHYYDWENADNGALW